MRNVECFRSSTVYWPFFEICLAKPENKTFRIDAHLGEIIGKKPKPKISTLFMETIEDLKKPANWLHYLKELTEDLGKVAYKLLQNRNVQIVILILILILALSAVYK